MNSKEIISRYIGALEDDLQHYTMVDKDKVKAKFIEFQLEEYRIIKQDLERLEKLEKVIEKIKNLSNCDNGCMYLQNKLKKILLIDNFENMFINCKLTPLPELEEE